MCAKDGGGPKGGEIDLESLMAERLVWRRAPVVVGSECELRLYLHAEVRQASTC